MTFDQAKVKKQTLLLPWTRDGIPIFVLKSTCLRVTDGFCNSCWFMLFFVCKNFYGLWTAAIPRSDDFDIDDLRERMPHRHQQHHHHDHHHEHQHLRESMEERSLVTGNFHDGQEDAKRFGDGKKGSLEKHERGKWTYHDHLLIMKSHVQPLALSEFIGDRQISTTSPAKWSILAVGQLIWLRETNCPVSPTDYPLVKSGKWLYIYIQCYFNSTLFSWLRS